MNGATAEATAAAAAPEGLPKWEAVCKTEDKDLQPTAAAIRCLSAGPDDILVTGSSRPVVKVWKVAEAKVEVTHNLKRGAVGSSCVEVSAEDGQAVAVCSDDGNIALWDLRDKNRRETLESTIASSFRAKFLPGGRRLVAGGSSGILRVWDLRTNTLAAEVAPESSLHPARSAKRSRKDEKSREASHKPSPVFSLAVSRDGRLLACGRSSGEVGLLRIADLDSSAGAHESYSWVGEVSAHQGESTASTPVRALAFDATSRLLLSGGDDGNCVLADAAEWSRRQTALSVTSPGVTPTPPSLDRFPAHRGWVTSASFCPESPALLQHRVAVTTSWDFSVKLWDCSTNQLLRSYQDHTDGVLASSFSSGPSIWFATAGADSRLIVYAPKAAGEETK